MEVKRSSTATAGVVAALGLGFGAILSFTHEIVGYREEGEKRRDVMQVYGLVFWDTTSTPSGVKLELPKAQSHLVTGSVG